MKKKEKSIIELQQEKVDMGHLWVNAIDLINPSVETRLKIGDTIIEMLERVYPRSIKLTANKS